MSLIAAPGFPVNVAHRPMSTLVLLSLVLSNLWPIWWRERERALPVSSVRTFLFVLLTYKIGITSQHFSFCLQPPHTLETRVQQLYDRRNSRTAVRWDHVGVQYRGGQHEGETTRGLICPERESNNLHHHLFSKVLYTQLVFSRAEPLEL